MAREPTVVGSGPLGLDQAVKACGAATSGIITMYCRALGDNGDATKESEGGSIGTALSWRRRELYGAESDFTVSVTKGHTAGKR